MALLTFLGGIRSFMGSSENYNTLEIQKDGDGNFLLVIQEHNDLGNTRSGSVRIEAPSGDIGGREIHAAVANLVELIQNHHKKRPRVCIVSRDT